MIMHIIRWFRRLKTAEESHIPESTDFNQREYDRYSISFPVIISGCDDKGVESHERTILQDISGNGALFRSRIPEKYYPGQLLKISIMLDGTVDVQARVRTEATVVRIHYNGEESKLPDDDAESIGIAVQFDRSFEFERIDHVGTG